MFLNYGSYYYLIIGLQIFCAVHSYRRGTLNRWLLLIIFLPVIGSIIYLYSEVIQGGKSFVKPVNYSKAGSKPRTNIKKLEEELRFTDTFANRVKLADAYLATGETEKAIELYTTSLTGAFAENEHVMQQLMVAYYEQKQYGDVVRLAKKLYKLPQFARSKWHMLYAMSLEKLGEIEKAETEFKLMKGRYAYFEQRYQYGLFLKRNNRDEEAKQIFTNMLEEEAHLSPVERKSNRTWFVKAKEELRKI
jgi:hypothetical protein